MVVEAIEPISRSKIEQPKTAPAKEQAVQLAHTDAATAQAKREINAADHLSRDYSHIGDDALRMQLMESARQTYRRACEHTPKSSDPLLNVNESSLRMANAVGEMMNHHSHLLDRNTAAVQQLTELRSLLEHHKHLDKMEHGELPDRVQQLLPVARQHGVLWPENEGWANEQERDARIQGLEFASQSLSKTGEQLTLKMQHAQNTYNQHLMNAAYAIHRQAKIIELVLQLLARS